MPSRSPRSDARVAAKLQKLAQVPVRMIISSTTFARGLNAPRKRIMSAILKPYAIICKLFLTQNAFPRPRQSCDRGCPYHIESSAIWKTRAISPANVMDGGSNIKRLVQYLLSWAAASYPYDRRALAVGMGEGLQTCTERGYWRGGTSSCYEPETSGRAGVKETWGGLGGLVRCGVKEG
jgi:hypothetical protein